MKRGKKMLCLLLALAVLVGGYYLVTALTAKKSDATETAGSFDVTDLTTDSLAAMSWTHEGENVRLVKNGDTWQCADNASFPLDQDKASGLAADLTAMKGTREIKDIATTTDYGVTADSFAVTAKNTDGQEYVFRAGDKTLLGDEYYLTVSSKDATVYTVASALSDQFGKGLNDLAVWETLPAVGTATQVTIGTAVNQTWDAGAGCWYRTGTQEAADKDSVDALVTAIGNISFDSLVTWDADDAAKTAYGLSTGTDLKVVSTDKDGKTTARELTLGSVDSASGNTYACLPGSKMVYLIKADSLTDITDASDATLRDKTVSTLTWDNLATLTVTDGTDSRTFVRTAAPAGTATPTDATTADTVTLSGQTVDASAVQALFTSLTAKAESACYDADSSAPMILTATLTPISGDPETLVFRAYNADTYFLDSPQAGKLLVSADTIDKLVRTYKTIQ